jgi:predicted O-linked N-acetylglucosamine transferase (SPINDLY family)
MSKGGLALVESSMAQGQLAQALQQVDALLAQDATHAQAWRTKGSIHAQMGDMGAAIQCYNQALQRKPDFADACFDLARALEDTGQLALAIQVYEHLLQLSPGHKGGGRLVSLRSGQAASQMLEQCFATGNQLLQQQRNSEAVIAYQQALAIRADVPEVLSNMGVALLRLRQFGQAEQVLLRCVQLRPKFPEALNTLGNVYKDIGVYDKAVGCYRQAVAADAQFVFAWVNLGKALQEMDNHAGAAEAYERALAINPRLAETLAELLHRLNYLCRWEKTARLARELEQVLLAGEQAVIPFIAALYCSGAAQMKNAVRWSATHYPHGVAYQPHVPLPADARGDKKLRIGYVSADYHRNATALLISELFERHDRGAFEIFAYSCGSDDGSEERKRIVGSVEFRDIQHMDDAAAAQLIRQDGIDVLVDLKGYTVNHRMGVMALRPAPVQVHYLGYPGTTGATFIDYFITDAVCSPVDADTTFSEKLVRLAHAYQINDRKRPLPKEGSKRADYGLPEGAFVFGDFNQCYKITVDIFSVWLNLLEAVDGSVLWLFETVGEAMEHLRRAAVARGIDPARIVTAGVAAPAEHLQRYAHVDMFLDTFPVCGHTTASDALWCGVPVVAMTGEHFASRVSGSLLAAVGLPELAVETLEAYEALALSLARDRGRLVALKAHLREQRMAVPLFDSARTTAALEAAYAQMSALHRQGRMPAAFRLDADGGVI